MAISEKSAWDSTGHLTEEWILGCSDDVLSQIVKATSLITAKAGCVDAHDEADATVDRKVRSGEKLARQECVKFLLRRRVCAAPDSSEPAAGPAKIVDSEAPSV